MTASPRPAGVDASTSRDERLYVLLEQLLTLIHRQQRDAAPAAISDASAVSILAELRALGAKFDSHTEHSAARHADMHRSVHELQEAVSQLKVAVAHLESRQDAAEGRKASVAPGPLSALLERLSGKFGQAAVIALLVVLLGDDAIRGDNLLGYVVRALTGAGPAAAPVIDDLRGAIP